MVTPSSVCRATAVAATRRVLLRCPERRDIGPHDDTELAVQGTPGLDVHEISPIRSRSCAERLTTGREARLRRGYFDRDSGKGFGFDKTFHKHNLKRTGVFAFVIRNPDCGEGVITAFCEGHPHGARAPG
jgi:hypothetical protein